MAITMLAGITLVTCSVSGLRFMDWFAGLKVTNILRVITYRNKSIAVRTTMASYSIISALTQIKPILKET